MCVLIMKVLLLVVVLLMKMLLGLLVMLLVLLRRLRLLWCGWRRIPQEMQRARCGLRRGHEAGLRAALRARERDPMADGSAVALRTGRAAERGWC